MIRLSGAMPPELEIYTALKENQLAHFYEPEPGLFIAESPQVIRMAMEAGYEPESFLLEEGREEKILADPGAGGIIRTACLSGDRTACLSGACTGNRTDNRSADFFDACFGDFSDVHSEDLRRQGRGYVNQIPDLKSEFSQNGEKFYVNKNDPGFPIYLAPHEELVKLAGYELTGGALAAFRRKPLPKPEEILKNVRRAVALECVMNPRNIGSIFRSAAALGFGAVLLTKGCGDPLYRRAARVSMGTVFRIPWTFVDDVSVLKENGFTTVAMALTDESVSMDDVVLKGHDRLAVLMGSERTGLREETIKNADYTAKIPMKHGVDSLNVAAASAVAFWELR